MNSARTSHCPTSTPKTPLNVVPLSNQTSPTSPIFPDTPIESVPSSATFSTTSTIVDRNKSGAGADGVARMIRRKLSSTVLRPLHGNNSTDWTISPLPPNTITTDISTSRSCTRLIKTQHDTRRRLGLPRSVTAPLTRIFHHQGGNEDNGNGWDFTCCGESRVMTERGGPGWLGTLDFEEPATPRAATKTFTPITGDLSTSPEDVGVLGSPWSPKNDWSQAWDEAAASLESGRSTPPLTSESSGWSPASAEASLASPSSSQSFGGLYIASPPSSLASPEAISSIYSTPSQNPLRKRSEALKPGPTRRLKISINTISTPVVKDLNSESHVPQIRH